MGYIFDAMNRAGDDDGPPDGPSAPRDQGPPLPFDASATPELPAPPPPAEDDDSPAVIAELDSLAAGSADRQAAPEPPTDPDDDAPPAALPMDLHWLRQVDDRLVVLTDPGSVIAEEYRSIRTSILARWKNRRRLVHTITSATPQEGKTITSMNLGLSFAELRNRRTVIVECDLRLPTISKLLKIDPAPGLIGYLNGDLPLDRIIRKIGDDGVHLITAGGRANNDAVQMLSSQRMANLLEALRARFDHVIIDTPPVVELADAGIIGAQSDDVLLIARMNRTPKSLIERAVRTLGSYNAPVVGMVATDQKRLRRRYYYYRYGYRYRYNGRQAA